MRNPELIDLRLLDAAAFALYKREHPESIAESWETVGLPIVLEYRDKANVVLVSYFVPALLPSHLCDACIINSPRKCHQHRS